MIDRFIARLPPRPGRGARGDGDPGARARAQAGRHERAARPSCVRLAHGMTPAKLAEVVGQLNALEIAFAYSKMRARRTPGNQAHVTNAKDDPLQLAADAATAVALGFDEIETTHARRAQRLVERARLRGRRRGRPLGHAVPVLQSRRRRSCRSPWPASPPMPRPSRSTAPSAPSSTATTRPGPRLSSPPPMPRAASRCAAPPGAGSELLMGFHESQVAALPRGALPLPAARHGRAGHAERRHRRRAGHLHACPAACAS